MNQSKLTNQILDGMKIGFDTVCSPKSFGGFEVWLCHTVRQDLEDGEDRLFSLGLQLVRAAHQLFLTGLMPATDEEKTLVQATAEILGAIQEVRIRALAMGSSYLDFDEAEANDDLQS